MPDLLEPPFTVDRSAPATPRCRRHASGHTPHFIQVRLCAQSPHEDWRRVVVMCVRRDVVVLADGDELRSYRNHAAEYLAWVVGRVGAEAELNTDHNVLFLRPWPDGGRSVFSVQPVERPREDCATGDMPA